MTFSSPGGFQGLRGGEDQAALHGTGGGAGSYDEARGKTDAEGIATRTIHCRL